MKNVQIAELRARLREYLRHVRRGHSLTVLDGNTPIACIVPHAAQEDTVEVRPRVRKYPSLQRVPLPAPLRVRTDVVQLLLEERRGER